MYVLTRSNQKEPIKFDKITDRIEVLSKGLNQNFIDSSKIAKKVIEGIYDGISTRELDQLAAETAAYLSTLHPDYSKLAGRIAVSNLHKETLGCFSENIKLMYNMFDDRTNKKAPLISKELYQFVIKNADRLDREIVDKRDLEYDYFGFKTLERSYLLRDSKGKILERPSHMLMRVSLGIHLDDIEEAMKTYNLMSLKFFTHASPTLFNSGTNKQQLSSCFVIDIKDDSINGIYDTIKQTALISQSAGGIGLSIHKIRAKGSYIQGTNGFSNGIIPMLKVFNDTARYVDQGGGKRKGAFAVYLEPWHADIFDFLELKKNTGHEDMRARDLFYALWICDLFMKRVEEDGMWSLFCPSEAPNLYNTHGQEFEELYTKYERLGLAKKVIRAQDLWFAILESQIETGSPFMLYKDAVNAKSNQKNLGTIKSSNLCTEILEYTDENEVAVCNLASVSLKKFVLLKQDQVEYDFKSLFDVVYKMTKNLNKIIDINYYPVKEAQNSNLKHRPIGLGVQGLADTFFLMKYNYESKEALELNNKIFETIYFAALSASCDLAKSDGSYSSFEGSPLSKGEFQFDLWNHKVDDSLWNWSELKQKVAKYGARNSLLVAPMPTASTSQILGNTECFEPITSNLYVRRVLSGEFAVINNYLVSDLIKLKIWDDDMRNEIMAKNGSIQNINRIPQDIKDLYKTVWEIKQKSVIEMAAGRAPFIDQGQSLNIHMESPNFGKLSSMHFHAWKKGLKTGMYYLRTRAAVNAVKFTIDKKYTSADSSKSKNDKTTDKDYYRDQMTCSIDNPEECVMCGS